MFHDNVRLDSRGGKVELLGTNLKNVEIIIFKFY